MRRKRPAHVTIHLCLLLWGHLFGRRCGRVRLRCAPSIGLLCRGIGRRMVEALFALYRGCGIMLVGTGDSPMTLGFYRACGFAFSHVEKDFFVKNYDHPIVEEGVLLRDMVYFRKELTDTPGE